MTPHREFTAGIRAELPILLGVLPIGLIYGALALQAGIPPAPAFAMSSIVFAGSAQFVATQLIGAGTPVGLLLLTTFVVNLRHLLYSASLAPYLRPLRPAWRPRSPTCSRTRPTRWRSHTTTRLHRPARHRRRAATNRITATGFSWGP